MTAGELVELLRAMAELPSGEADSLSALDHGLQCAAGLAMARPDDVELALAGLVHDVGHRFGSDEDHARLGAEEVRPALGDRIADLVGAHVMAKRYLVASEPAYRGTLSPDSTRTLALQGGALSTEEVRAFLLSPWALDAVALRRADEAAKVPGRSVPTLGHWIPHLLRVVPTPAGGAAP